MLAILFFRVGSAIYFSKGGVDISFSVVGSSATQLNLLGFETFVFILKINYTFHRIQFIRVIKTEKNVTLVILLFLIKL